MWSHKAIFTDSAEPGIDFETSRRGSIRALVATRWVSPVTVQCHRQTFRSYSKQSWHINLNEKMAVVEVTLRPTVSRPVCPGVRRPSGTSDQFFFLLEIFFRQLRVCYFVTPSLTRGRVCNLLLLLVLASAVPLGSALSDGRSGQSFVSISL
jgi:hypothetical protein